MRLLVVSDIHGSKSSAAAAEPLFRRHACDSILCLGDVLYHGPRNDLPEDYAPKEVIALLNPLKDHILGVRGNCDAEVDQMVLEFDVHSDFRRIALEKRTVFMTHGHLETAPLFSPIPGSAILSGHTHIPTAEKRNGIYYLNPGSMTIPKDGHPRSYAILEEEGFTVYRLEDDSAFMEILFD